MGAMFSDSQGEDSYKITLNKEALLGEGSYAEVYKIQRKKDGLECAAKLFRVPLSHMNSIEMTGCERELKILKQANHPFIIQYLEEFPYQNKRLCIVTKFASGGDFEKLI